MEINLQIEERNMYIFKASLTNFHAHLNISKHDLEMLLIVWLYVINLLQ